MIGQSKNYLSNLPFNNLCPPVSFDWHCGIAKELESI